MRPEIMNVIRRPLVTEKNTSHIGRNIYAFEVKPEATKHLIAKAVEKVFEVKVLSVRTLNCRKRPKRVGRFVGKTTYFKKALVELGEGHKIKIFEGA